MRLRQFSLKNILLLLAAVLFLGIAVSPVHTYAATTKGLEKIKTVKVRNLNKKVRIMWTKNRKADGYVIYQQDSTGEFVLRKRVGKSKSRTTITKLTNNKTYKFKVAAYRNIKGQKVIGKLSDAVSGTPFDTGRISKIHAYYYKGTMRDTVTVKGVTFRQGQTVTVNAKNGSGRIISIYSSGNTLVPILHKGKLYNVPASKVQLSGFISNYKKAYSGKLAEQYVNYKGFSSPTKYFLWVSTYGQRVYIFEGSQFNWKLIKNWICSTGMFKGEDDRKTPTQLGPGYIKGRLDIWQWSEYQYAYYCLSMHPGGWFHSWLYYPPAWSWSSYGAAVGKLGTPSSHGCVRLDRNNCKWMYDHLPDGTRYIVN